MAGLLPNTFIIGAAKCGTTGLWLYLDAHPEIAFSANKEPAFFVRPHYRDDLAWYEALFRPATVRGEASTVYTTHPVNSGVPERIRSLVPEAKLIYMVRDPVDRMISHYVEHVAQGIEHRAIETALAEPEARNMYLAASLYATQVRQYLDYFEESSLLILDQDELRDEPLPTLARVYRFLGVDESFRPPHTEVQVRRTAERRRFIGFGGRLRQTRAAETALRWIWRLPPRLAIRVVGALKRPLSAPIERPALDRGLEDDLRARLSPEAAWLREYTGKSFDSWSC